jgi:hypothetical protein
MVTSLKLLQRRSEVVVTFVFLSLERRRVAMTMPACLGMEGDRVMVTPIFPSAKLYLPSSGKRGSEVIVTSILHYLDGMRVAMSLPSSLFEGTGMRSLSPPSSLIWKEVDWP